MEWFVKAFLKSSLTWLALGVTLGVAMAAHPVWTIYRPAHLHILLVGFVTMMIYGVAYHIIPRFAGFVLYSRRAAIWQLGMANGGLVLMVAGFAIRANGHSVGTPVLATGGLIAALAAYVFAFVIWRTMDGSADARAAAKRLAEASARRTTLPISR